MFRGGTHLDPRCSVSLSSSALRRSRHAWQPANPCNKAQREAPTVWLQASPQRLVVSSSIARLPVRGSCAWEEAESVWDGRLPATSWPRVGSPLPGRHVFSGTHSQTRGLQQLTLGPAAAQALSAAQRCCGCNRRLVLSGIDCGPSFGSSGLGGRGRHGQTASAAPGRGTRLSAVAQDTVTVGDVEAPPVAQSAGHDQSPVGASAAEVSECGEHTGETDDDEAAVGADMVPCYTGEPEALCTLLVSVQSVLSKPT
jgi:hypothetical protein